jgi:type IV fimbrial biogenesis protein FimT
MGGFTAVEMMIVVLIIGILASLAVPAMRDMIRMQRVKTASFDLFAGLVLARSEAIKRNTSVTLTPVGGNWVLGWTTTDPNGNVLARQDAFVATKNGAVDNDSASLTLAGPNSVTFNGMGRAVAVAQFSIAAADMATTDDRRYRCVKLDLSGRPVSNTGVCA